MSCSFILQPVGGVNHSVIMRSPVPGTVYTYDTRILVKVAYSGAMRTYKQFTYSPISSIKLNFDHIDEDTFLSFVALLIEYLKYVHKTGSEFVTITYIDDQDVTKKVRLNQQGLDSVIKSKYYDSLDAYSFTLTLDIWTGGVT